MKTQNVLRIGQLANTLEAQELKRPDLVAELKAIFIAETGENPWAKPIEDMSQAHLDSLRDTYLGECDNLANFHTFWHNYLSTDPEPEEISKLFQQIKEWGYVLDEVSETI
ncbi:hypothetical protein GO755_33605 [Spirosoma sp. HMF4905]|uniref:Uncharacterized protein n=1 Tax=Spirosoma arboris TaxID=2682092 RepID=A0A7K1SMI7_9BACT|nr:hypothetical protein [Spirosoma arboris]MVM35012.1 hypothetical protein [Spirosoma arboris]